MKRALAATAVATLLLAACSSSSSSSTGAASSSTSATADAISVQLTEFAFVMPDQIPAGVQTLHVENIGGMPHFIDFSSVKGDQTDEDIQTLLEDPNAKQPSWLGDAGIPNISLVSPGVSTDITLDLPPGRYAAFCWMPDAQGTPHAIVGMHQVFDVVGDPAGSFPQADMTLTWDGSALLGLPDTVDPGTYAIAMENTGSKPGQVAVAQALEDVPVDQLKKDVNTYFKSLYQGSSPVNFMGGLTNMQSDIGVNGITTVTFTDGTYLVAGPGSSDPIMFTVGSGGYPSPSASMEPASCTPNGTALTLTASGATFDTDCLAAPADEAFTIAFDNQDASTQHNVAIYPEADGSDAVFTGDVVTGVATTTYDVSALQAGTYRFQCDVHPTTMNGTFIVG